MSEPKYLNPWNYKPWWCQPWSIILTGLMLISGSWLLFKIIWLTILISIPVLTWMGFFVSLAQLIIQSGILNSSSENLVQNAIPESGKEQGQVSR